MPVFSINAPVALEQTRFSIGFDANTSGFFVYKNDACVAVFELAESRALLAEIQRALGKTSVTTGEAK